MDIRLTNRIKSSYEIKPPKKQKILLPFAKVQNNIPLDRS